MREIKFRAWVVNNFMSEMHYSSEIQMNSADAISLWYKVGFEDAHPENTNIDDWQKNIKWMQYTGLQDKNGKDVYESDIIYNNDLKCYCEVKMIDGCWKTVYPKDPLNLRDSNFLLYHTLENLYCVTGNIYETKI